MPYYQPIVEEKQMTTRPSQKKWESQTILLKTLCRTVGTLPKPGGDRSR